MAHGSESKEPLKALPREELEQNIIEFLASQKLCVLATAKDNAPRATTLSYRVEGTTLYIGCRHGKKLENIRANPQVSVAIYAPMDGWLSVKGVQITGQAKIVTDTDAECADAWKIHNKANAGKEGWDVPPEGIILIVVESQKIELIETVLEERGYKIYQEWEA